MKHGTGKQRRQTALSWLFVAGLFVLCGVLGVLQYGWIGEVSEAARDRLRGSLQASLNRISFDFGVEIATAARALLPVDAALDSAAMETEMAARYAQWKTTARHGQMFRQIAIAEPRNKVLVLRSLNLDQATFETSVWPSDWAPMKARLESMLTAEGRPGRGFPGPPPDTQGMFFDLPAFPPSGPGPPRRSAQPRRSSFTDLRFKPGICARRDAAGTASAASGIERYARVSGGSLDPAASSRSHLPNRSRSAGGCHRRRISGPV